MNSGYGGNEPKVPFISPTRPRINRPARTVRPTAGLSAATPNEVGIRRAPSYPGKRTGEEITVGEVVAFSHLHNDDKIHSITFYRLADGRG